MNILVTGANGQLGSELRVIAQKCGTDKNFVFTDVDDLDITNVDAVREMVVSEKIDVIVNCAAYTNVDKAESEPEIAAKINSIGPKALANVAAENNTLIVHISTDYVFDGTKSEPYLETDPVAPMGVYGKTKLDGEKAVIESGCKGVIIRTAWLYSSFGNNFVKTMIRLGREKEQIYVVNDQIGTPTYAADLAQEIVEILPKIASKPAIIYNYSGMGEVSWFDFATKIISLAGLKCDVLPVSSADYPSPTKRPQYSVLNKEKIVTDLGIVIPCWEESLEKSIHLVMSKS